MPERGLPCERWSASEAMALVANLERKWGHVRKGRDGGEMRRSALDPHDAEDGARGAVDLLLEFEQLAEFAEMGADV